MVSLSEDEVPGLKKYQDQLVKGGLKKAFVVPTQHLEEKEVQELVETPLSKRITLDLFRGKTYTHDVSLIAGSEDKEKWFAFRDLSEDDNLDFQYVVSSSFGGLADPSAANDEFPMQLNISIESLTRDHRFDLALDSEEVTGDDWNTLLKHCEDLLLCC
jgi:hypothetical protein